MDEYTRANLDWWNEAATIHSQGEGYDVASFKAGKNRLHPLELEEVGDVTGKKLLHLQCHFGLHEHPFCAWECFKDMEEGEDRFLRFKDLARRDLIPLMFSLKATKPTS